MQRIRAVLIGNMPQKCKETTQARAPVKTTISVERLTVDVFRHITTIFQVNPEAIPKPTLPKNAYDSTTFIKDFARPVLLYSLLMRDANKKRFERGRAEKMADMKENLEYFCVVLFETLRGSDEREIFVEVVLTLTIALEMTLYLHAVNHRDLLQDIPEIWASIFKNKMAVAFEEAGGLKKFLLYWDFAKHVDALTSQFVKMSIPYGKSVSGEYMKCLRESEKFQERDVQLKLSGHVVCSRFDGFMGKPMFETISRLGFIPHELRFPMEWQPYSPKDGETLQTDASMKRSKKTKLKPKPGQSYARYEAEKRAMKMDEKKDTDINREGMERLD